MGGTTYELDMPVTFELDTHAKEQKLNEFLDWVCREYGQEMWAFFKDNYDGILENKLIVPWGDFPKGMKLSKVLMKEFGLDAEDVRQKLSMLIQSNKVTGKFCLSVHPLDYLSASENNHGWRSCHALDGEYRGGNVSYMVDKVTIMAYLKSTTPDTKLPRFPADVPWNDKKWRCYFFVDTTNKLIYAGRQYPFHSDTALEIAAQLFAKMYFFDLEFQKYWCAHQREADRWGYTREESPCIKPFIHRCLKADTEINGVHWDFGQTKIITGTPGEDLRVVPLKNFIETHRDALCYNDLLDSHTYAPYVCSYESDGSIYIPYRPTGKMVVGAPFKCLCCNTRLQGDSDTFFCYDCKEGGYEPDEWYEEEQEVDESTEADTHNYWTPPLFHWA